MAAGASEVEILKPRCDKREYRRIVLPNSLEALIISDPETDKAAASMNVSVGSFSDPDGLEGLAHFLGASNKSVQLGVHIITPLLDAELALKLESRDSSQLKQRPLALRSAILACVRRLKNEAGGVSLLMSLVVLVFAKGGGPPLRVFRLLSKVRAGTVAGSLLPSLSASDLLALPEGSNLFLFHLIKSKLGFLYQVKGRNSIFKYSGTRVPLIGSSGLTSEALEGSLHASRVVCGGPCLNYKFIVHMQHGGSRNAYTASEHTNYHFDVNVDSFEEALDR
ncbi:hypothetical protein ZIOFF_060797 [Zingiber officinale]|uniref:Peptidase M16 N-terminal domain-containing protein n=1 Tax=Zingiber officinale TaxID=94328 RepID=A0A8J5FB48_ZINOF|nr:hypothetical protein ZIOFF_060797 [Zingiber officinale]